MKNFFFLLIACVVLGLVFSFDDTRQFVGLNFDASSVSDGRNSVFTMLWIFLCMLFGILFGHAYRALAAISGKGAVHFSTLISRIPGTDLWRSLLSSPIVFGVIYLLARDQPDIVVSSILAFENGFICNVVAEKRINTLTTGE